MCTSYENASRFDVHCIAKETALLKIVCTIFVAASVFSFRFFFCLVGYHDDDGWIHANVSFRIGNQTEPNRNKTLYT